MGFGGWLEWIIHGHAGNANRRSRRLVNDKLRDEIAELKRQLKQSETFREQAETKLQRVVSDFAREKDRADDLSSLTRQQRETIDVLTVQGEGQAKVIVCQQTTIDAMTARASAQIAAAQTNGGGFTDAQRVLTRN